MEASWSDDILAPTIMWRTAKSSSRVILSSSSKSYLIMTGIKRNKDTRHHHVLSFSHKNRHRVCNATKIYRMQRTYILKANLNFSSLLFSLFSLLFLIGLNRAKTRINCLKLILSSPLVSPKKAWTIRSPRGLMANSGIRRKSSRDKVPLSPLSKEVNRLYSRSIWFGETVHDTQTVKNQWNQCQAYNNVILTSSLFLNGLDLFILKHQWCLVPHDDMLLLRQLQILSKLLMVMIIAVMRVSRRCPKDYDVWEILDLGNAITTTNTNTDSWETSLTPPSLSDDVFQEVLEEALQDLRKTDRHFHFWRRHQETTLVALLSKFCEWSTLNTCVLFANLFTVSDHKIGLKTFKETEL